MLPNWSALPGHQGRQNQDEERPLAGEAAPAIGEVAQPTEEAVGGVVPTPSIGIPITGDPLHVDVSLLHIPPGRQGMLAGYAGPQPYQTD